ncbi:MAG: tryptophan-rich sensory protein [Ruminococcus sp.]|nr:tryptophan-rich sensory protein [Ruminococcus sp.]
MKRFSLTDLIIFVVVTELVGAVSALIAGNFSMFYSQITQPPLSPPAIVFPVVWAVLYALMGISAYMIYRTGKNYALRIYIIQLAVNFSWSIIFFRFRFFTLAAIVAVILFLLVGTMIFVFSRVRKISALLNIPYLLWCAFAAYLAIGVCVLN